jgi:16S rRNA (adenine1518-N6/adenine1519-N6)-dimethyltransferase
MSKVDAQNWGVLSILAQRLGNVSLITKAPNTCFWPQPKITSACVRVVPKEVKPASDNDGFAKFVTGLFAKRRKQLGSIIGRDVVLPDGISAEARPSTLTISQLEQLFLLYTFSK